MKTVIAGSRESKLALAQTREATAYIEANNKDTKAEILAMKTTGDRILDKKLESVGGKGLFVKELDVALREGRVHFAVHSLKDLPMETAADLPVLGYSRREDARDVLVLPEGVSELDFSKPVGCSSSRRILQFQKLYPQAQIKSVRGNVLTRLDKLDRGEYSALILAAAGLKRLGLCRRISRYFTEDEMIPAAGQGILCVQGRENEDYGYLDGFFNEEAAYMAEAERAFVRYFNGGCTLPVAAHATIQGKQLCLKAFYAQETGGTCVTGRIVGSVEDAEKIGLQLAVRLEQELESAEPKPRIDALTYRPGKVCLVGAGPSDVDLLTKRGLDLLETADVIVYDSLVGQEILGLIPAGTRRIDVGKRAFRHKKQQWQINEILLREALSGNLAVRLKGGDPFLFGRGGEELDLLAKYHVPFEIVPGAASALAVPAYNGIPVTHRDFSSSVHMITGRQKEGNGCGIDFDALVRTKGTLVFLMGLNELETIAKGLLCAGMDGDTPAAVLQQGTCARQRRASAPLKDIAQEARRRDIQAPAVIVVGKVCALADKYSWYEKKPLFGEKIIVTRPRGRSPKLADSLKRMGAEVILLPTIRTERIQEEPLRQLISRTLAQIEGYDIAAFTSPYGVQAFFEFMREERVDIRRMHRACIAAIGPATAAELERRGLWAKILPPHYNAAALGDAIAAHCRGGEKILIPRAKAGSEELIPHLNKRPGLITTDLPVYETFDAPETAVDLLGQLENHEITMVTFTSASTVRGFVRMLPEGYDCSAVRAVCIGAQTEAEAKKYHMKTAAAKNATVEDMIDLIVRLHQAFPNSI